MSARTDEFFTAIDAPVRATTALIATTAKASLTRRETRFDRPQGKIFTATTQHHKPQKKPHPVASKATRCG